MSEEYIDNLKEQAKLFGEEREEMIQEVLKRVEMGMNEGRTPSPLTPGWVEGPNTDLEELLAIGNAAREAYYKKAADDFSLEPTPMEKLNEHIDINTAYIVLFFFIGLALGLWI